MRPIEIPSLLRNCEVSWNLGYETGGAKHNLSEGRAVLACDDLPTVGRQRCWIRLHLRRMERMHSARR